MLLSNSSLLAKADCFLAKENHKILKQVGDCESRHAPCSTFKLAISLMGYNEGLLLDETHPELSFEKGYTDWLENWKQPHKPTFWMKHSCVWYSQFITKKLGMYKFKKYLASFNYGNQDVTGDKGKNNGLTFSWLSSSLKISPQEQVEFIQKLIDNQLPVTIKAHQMTKNILVTEDLPNGWKLHGKTGSGNLISADGAEYNQRQIGWFVGWIENGNRIITFAHYIEDQSKQDTFASIRSKAAAKEKLTKLIQ